MPRALALAVLMICGSLAALTTLLTPPRYAVAGPSGSEKSIATNRLFRSVQANDFAGVQAAVSEGANVQARDRWGMTPTDIAVDRGYYRIAHFLTAARNLAADQQAASPGPNTNATGAAFSPLSVRETAPVRKETSRSTRIDSPPADEGSALEPWPEGEPHPFDPGAPAPGSQLRSMRGH